jgi:hypothetical protein
MEKELKLVKPEYQQQQHDADFWKQQQPTEIPPVGLQDIKWKELHHKWGPYVPQEKNAIHSPFTFVTQGP